MNDQPGGKQDYLRLSLAIESYKLQEQTPDSELQCLRVINSCVPNFFLASLLDWDFWAQSQVL